jgi:hypothetical protein
MMRSLYRYLLHLHPPRFRDRFEDEMLLVFDAAVTRKRKLWLLSDGFASLLRQWALRPYYEPAETQRHAVASDGVPTFAMLGQTRPRASALLFGGVVSGVMLSSVILGSFFAPSHPRYGNAIVDIHWSWGWTLPDSRPEGSPAALRLREWLDIYNAGDVVAMRRFTAMNFLNFARYPDNTPNVEFWTRLFERVGPLQLNSVRQSRGDGITGVARSKNGDWWWIRLDIYWDARHLVRAVEVQNLADARIPPRE